MRPDGVLVVVGAPKGQWLAPVLHIMAAVVLSRLGSQRLVPFLAERRQSDLIVLKDFIEAGAVRPVIDRTYPFDETAAAHPPHRDRPPGRQGRHQHVGPRRDPRRSSC